MLKTSLIGGIVGGIILFLWGAASWMLLPWHMSTLHSFKDETAVVQVIQTNAPESGIYLSPLQQTSTAPGPMVFASVYTKGMPSSMVPSMVIEFIIQLIAAFLVTWMLTKTTLGYLGRLGFVLVFALAVGITTDLMYWNWFHFDTKYTLVLLADLLIGWFLAGLLLAKLSAR